MIVTALGADSRDWPDVGLEETSVLALAAGAISSATTVIAALNTFFIYPLVDAYWVLIRAYRLTSLDYDTSRRAINHKKKGHI